MNMSRSILLFNSYLCVGFETSTSLLIVPDTRCLQYKTGQHPESPISFLHLTCNKNIIEMPFSALHSFISNSSSNKKQATHLTCCRSFCTGNEYKVLKFSQANERVEMQ